MKGVHGSSRWPSVGIALFLLFAIGCGKKDAGGSDAKASASPPSDARAAATPSDSNAGQENPEAVAALNEELARRWLRTPDGWISEYPAKTNVFTGERAGPESYYRQIKELKFNVEPNELSESDKLNGVQFMGLCKFTDAPMRIFGDPNAFGPPRWSEWKPSTEAVRVEKRGGHWLFAGVMGYLVAGTKPSAGTVAQLR
jgi:hypothetical protein